MEHPNQVTHATSKQLSLVDGEADDAGKLEEEAIHTHTRAYKWNPDKKMCVKEV